jgi:hypothetical protein
MKFSDAVLEHYGIRTSSDRTAGVSPTAEITTAMKIIEKAWGAVSSKHPAHRNLKRVYETLHDIHDELIDDLIGDSNYRGASTRKVRA